MQLFPRRPLRRLIVCYSLETTDPMWLPQSNDTLQVYGVRECGEESGVSASQCGWWRVTPLLMDAGVLERWEGGGCHGEDDCFVTRWHIGRLLGTRQSALHCSIQQHWPPKQDFIYRRTKCILQYPRFSNSNSLTLDLYRPSHCSNFIYEDL